MKKDSAVEWLENQIKTSKYYFKLMAEIKNRSTIVQPNIFEQAKEMEKEQMHAEYMRGWRDGYSCKSIKKELL
jgi:hypothetical protein